MNIYLPYFPIPHSNFVWGVHPTAEPVNGIVAWAAAPPSCTFWQAAFGSAEKAEWGAAGDTGYFWHGAEICAVQLAYLESINRFLK